MSPHSEGAAEDLLPYPANESHVAFDYYPRDAGKPGFYLKLRRTVVPVDLDPGVVNLYLCLVERNARRFVALRMGRYLFDLPFENSVLLIGQGRQLKVYRLALPQLADLGL